MEFEKRIFDADLRLASDKRKIAGYAAKFNSDSRDLGGFIETIRPGAFANSLKRDLEADPIMAFWNHETSMPLGSTRNGTLKLKEDNTGLYFECYPPKTSWSKDVRESIASGLICGCSFGFHVEQDDWRDGGSRRELQVISLQEISPVSQPAYPETEVNIRSKINMENLKQQAIKHLEKVTEYRNDPSRIDDYNFHAAEYDSLAERLAVPTFRDAGYTGVNDHWNKPAREVISKPDPSEFRDGARITGGHDRSGDRPWQSNGEFLRAVCQAGTPTGQVDSRLHNRAAGMSESIPSDGGFLVQQDFADDLLKQSWQTGQLAKLCKKIQVSGNSNKITWPGLDETSRAAGSRQGGIRGYWLEEAGLKTESAPTFRKIELHLNKLIGLCYSSDELLQDSSLLETFIRSAFGSEFGFMIDDAIINGLGVGQPLGILNSSALVTQDKEVGQAGSTVVAENVFAMWSRLFAASRANAVWLINQNLEPQLHTMSIAVGTGGIPVYMPAGGLSGKGYATLFGRPVYAVEQCESIGTLGDIYLADFTNGYILAEKGGMAYDKSIHVRFIYDESVFRFVTRIDGQPILSAPITPYKGGSSYTQSHFVALQERS